MPATAGSLLLRYDHQRARRVVAHLGGDGTEHRSLQATAPAGTDDEQTGGLGAPDDRVKNCNGNSGLQASQTGSSDYAKAPFNLFGGGQRQLPGAVPLDEPASGGVEPPRVGQLDLGL